VIPTKKAYEKQVINRNLPPTLKVEYPGIFAHIQVKREKGIPLGPKEKKQDITADKE
jgi:hypothetical protein